MTVSKFFEKHLPKIFFIAGFVVAYYVELPSDENYRLNSLLIATATVGSILSSLTGASIAGILTVKTKLTSRLREEGVYKDLMTFAYYSVLGSLALVMVALLGFFVADKLCYLCYYKYLYFAVFFYAMGAFHRVFTMMLSLGGHISSQDN